jgi:hypothetical protein
MLNLYAICAGYNEIVYITQLAQFTQFSPYMQGKNPRCEVLPDNVWPQELVFLFNHLSHTVLTQTVCSG